MPNVNTDEIQNIVRASASSALDLRGQIANFLQIAFADFAEGTNLNSIGNSRNLKRLKNESDVSFRRRILNAWEANKGAGDVGSLIYILEGLGYVFNSFVQGDTKKGNGSFNFIVRSLGGKTFNGTWTFDGTVYFDAPPPNGITIELIQPGDATDEQKKEILDALRPVIRASQKETLILAIH